MTTMTLPPAAGARRAEWYWAFGDARVLVGRSLRHIVRSPEQLMLMLFLPVTLLLMFRYLFGGAINTGDVSYLNYVIAGSISVSVTFNATVTSVAVAQDMLEGVVERFRTMPMHSAAVLVGHVTASVVQNLVSIAAMVGVGFLIGFRPAAGPGQWLAALGLLLLFATAVSWIAALLGMLAGTVEGANGLSMPLVFIPYVSSAFVPPATMPGGLRVIAENQPVSHLVDAVRALFMGQPAGDSAWLAVVWWAGLLVVLVPVAVRMFRRKAARAAR